MKIWYITRSYYPDITGGTIIRKAQVDIFQKMGYKVNIITPKYDKKLNYQIKFGLALEKIGLFEDYLDIWVKNNYSIFRNEIKSDDVIFATSGGELGCIKLGVLLKRYTKCKLVINYHDPLDYSYVNGCKINDRFHVSRDEVEKKYLSETNLIVTSSESHKNSLITKYPEFISKTYCNYFGYVSDAPISKKIQTEELTIAYGGTFSEAQSPHLLAVAAQGLDNINVTFIGNSKKYSALNPFRTNCRFLNQLSYNEYLKYMVNNVDLGFLSLANEYLGACVPSKLYEYINIGLPIIAALPDGDAKKIIIDNEYGLAVNHQNISDLRNCIELMKNKKLFNKFKNNILKDRESWSMEKRFQSVTNLIQNM